MTFRSLYTYINLLSIDVVAGSVTSYYFFCSFFKSQSSIVIATILGLTVWCIYTLDHLIDAKKMKACNLSQRHLFHKKHYSTLGFYALLAVGTIGVLLFWLDIQTLKYGMILSCFVIVYFISVHLLRLSKVIHKEFTVALIYVAGILIGPLSYIDRGLSAVECFVIFSFVHVALINLLLFSYIDVKADRIMGFPSLHNQLGEKFYPLFNYLVIQGIACCVIVIILGRPIIGLLFLLMLGSLIMLFYHRTYHQYSKTELYRCLGDGVFYILVLYFCI